MKHVFSRKHLVEATCVFARADLLLGRGCRRLKLWFRQSKNRPYLGPKPKIFPAVLAIMDRNLVNQRSSEAATGPRYCFGPAVQVLRPINDEYRNGGCLVSG